MRLKNVIDSHWLISVLADSTFTVSECIQLFSATAVTAAALESTTHTSVWSVDADLKDLSLCFHCIWSTGGKVISFYFHYPGELTFFNPTIQ